MEVSPIPIKSVKVQDSDENTDNQVEPPKGFTVPPNKIFVYEIWKVFLKDKKRKFAYVVVGADFMAEKYRKGVWSNVEYKGCYTTIQEAENEIKGYLI